VPRHDRMSDAVRANRTAVERRLQSCETTTGQCYFSYEIHLSYSYS